MLNRDCFYIKVGDNLMGFVSLYCGKCRTFLLLYQKEKAGVLKRLYFNKICAPKQFRGLDKIDFNLIGPLICKTCRVIIGTPKMIRKELCPAFIIEQRIKTKMTQYVNMSTLKASNNKLQLAT